MAARHDARYKRFFSNPVLFRQLLESFVSEDFVRELDFSTLKRVDKSFVTEEFRERESDLIHEVRYKDSTVYIFILIEFQRKVDHHMALRFLRYLYEFYQALEREGHAGKRNREGGHGGTLPAVFPLLLYSGSRRLTAPVSMRDLIDSRSGIPEHYLPHFDYCVIDENDYSQERLGQIRNTVSALFLAEKTPEDRPTEIDRMLYSLVRDEEPDAVRELFLWLRNVLGDDRHLDEELPELAGIEEKHAMLEETIRKHDRKVYAQGRQEGRQEGESIGMSKGFQEGMRLAAQKLKEHGRSREEIAALLGIDINELSVEP